MITTIAREANLAPEMGNRFIVYMRGIPSYAIHSVDVVNKPYDLITEYEIKLSVYVANTLSTDAILRAARDVRVLDIHFLNDKGIPHTKLYTKLTDTSLSSWRVNCSWKNDVPLSVELVYRRLKSFEIVGVLPTPVTYSTNKSS